MMKKNIYHILLVEEHPFIRMSIRAAIEDCSNNYLIEEAVHTQEAISWLDRQSFDLIIIDFALLENEEYNLIDTIRTSPSNTHAKILLFSSVNDANSITQAKNLGVSGFVSKDQDVSQLLLVIKTIQAGYSCFPIEKITNETLTPPSVEMLTAQETTIAKLLVKGMNNKMIADELSISSRSVSTHKSNILHKLGSKDKIVLARLLSSAYKES
ncbi:putative two-component response regulator [Yersinia pekkanenii]|uniref:Two-component response regulator n=2 Tax=Yersinia pekkanenii TaxID=1288385 RepID=A0A0T9NM25_9GAMM|nr:response regulator transcription factor [Yersinia pekkanenii]CNH19363.1 putative two-component response regulator [Yersinia pekkanenii]CRY66071.1 putative two-component response regulator [Yersinia pekkanenii]